MIEFERVTFMDNYFICEHRVRVRVCRVIEFRVIGTISFRVRVRVRVRVTVCI